MINSDVIVFYRWPNRNEPWADHCWPNARPSTVYRGESRVPIYIGGEGGSIISL